MTALSLLFIILSLLKIRDTYLYYRRKILVEIIMKESIDIFIKEHPETYNKIKSLNKSYYKELIYSGHLGSSRDGGEGDRQLNIAQDEKVNAIEQELRQLVKKSCFIFIIRDVMDKYGSDEKLTLMLLNRQDSGYSGTSVTVLDDLNIGFKSIPADRILKTFTY